MNKNYKVPKLSLVPDENQGTEAEQMEFESNSFDDAAPENPLIRDNRSPEEKRLDAKVGQELLDKNIDPECWAAALVSTSGDEQLATSLYVKWRKEKLQYSKLSLSKKLEGLEQRRLNSFVPRYTSSSVALATRDHYTEAIFWESLISLSSIGMFLSIARVLGLNPYLTIVISLLVTLIVVMSIRTHYHYQLNKQLSLSYPKVATIVAATAGVVSVAVTYIASIIEYWI